MHSPTRSGAGRKIQIKIGQQRLTLRVQSNVKSDGGGWSKVGFNNGRAAAENWGGQWPNVHEVADFGMIFLNDGSSGEKSLQRDAIVGRWDGHTLNLGCVGRLRSIVAL